jgi:hypothetical protein
LIKFFPLLISLILFSCNKQNIKFHKACNFKTIKGKEVLVCDEKMLRKVKSINYENRDCEKFEYVTVINGVEEESEGIKCKTSYGYEVIK